MAIINLRERFGRRYKIAFEEAYRHEYGPRAHIDDPWLQIIPGGRGHVYGWNSERLAASTNTSGSTARRLKALPGVQVWQDGTEGTTVLFSVDLLDQLADLLKLRRRRRPNDQERRRLAELSRRHGFQPRAASKLPSGNIAGSSLARRPCVPEAQPEPEDRAPYGFVGALEKAVRPTVAGRHGGQE